MTQLFGDRLMVANATGCSSIYGGNLPTTPYCQNEEGRGPVWSNSLFEDNAEFGLGMRLAADKQREYAHELVWKLGSAIGENLAQAILKADQKTEAGIVAQRERVKELKAKLKEIGTPEAGYLLDVADALVKKSVWIVGGDGWAYDIGYGGAVAKFAAGGKPSGKKDLAMMAVSYGSVYVARVAMGSSDMHTLKAFQEAEAFEGPSLIIAYSHCIAHGYDMAFGMDQQKAAVNSGYWPLFRYNPDLTAQNKNPFQLDSRAPSIALKDYIYNETRYTMLVKSNPEHAKKLLDEAQEDVNSHWKLYDYMAHEPFAVEVKK